jgi:glutamate 5-kinase
VITRKDIKKTKRWVIKIGSALLTNDGQGLNKQAIQNWVDQMVYLTHQGIEVIIVSSGSIAEGMQRLGWKHRPTEIAKLQSAAAVGQMGLIQTYESAFSKHGVHTAQILMTHDDLSNRSRYLNASNTIKTLLSCGIVPIINENDTVITDEIRFGDNDTLAALTTNLISADLLVILTDQKGLYDDNPRTNPKAQLIQQTLVSCKGIEKMATSDGGSLGKGGMYTKVMAAKRAARSGAATLIASGKEDNILEKLYAGENIGSLLIPDLEPMNARKQWIAGHLLAKGTLTIDNGAEKALTKSNKSLLPVGVTNITGEFQSGEMVVCKNLQGLIIARGIISYSSAETNKILGKSSTQIQELLGFSNGKYLIHRDNLVVCENYHS